MRHLAEAHTTQSDPFPAPFPATKCPVDSESSSGFRTSRSSSPSPAASPNRQSSDPNSTWKTIPEEVVDRYDMSEVYCRVCEASARVMDSTVSGASLKGEKSAPRSSSVSPLPSVSVAGAEFNLTSSSDSSSSDGANARSRGRVHCVACLSGVTTSSTKANSEGDFQSSHTSTTDAAHPGCSRSDRVMVNFRELLWYWREYYLRRGRDRLSIEFSSHIPFFQWNSLVGKTRFMHSFVAVVVRQGWRVILSSLSNLRDLTF